MESKVKKPTQLRLFARFGLPQQPDASKLTKYGEIDHRKLKSRAITANDERILDAYRQHKSYQTAGNELGVSRQRVEQVVKKVILLTGDETLIHIVNKRKHVGEHCKNCYRPFTDKRKWSKGGYCNACGNWLKRKEAGMPQRGQLLLAPTMCSNCATPFSRESWRTKRTVDDLCALCYSKTDKYRAHQARYNKRPEVRAKRNKYQKEYMQAHPEAYEHWKKQGAEWRKRHYHENLEEERKKQRDRYRLKAYEIVIQKGTWGRRSQQERENIIAMLTPEQKTILDERVKE